MNINKDITLTKYQQVLFALIEYIENEKYAGYDPYDALMGKCKFKIFGKWGPALAVQFIKRNPINLRPLFGIKKSINPKAIGLMLQAYCILYEITKEKKWLDQSHLFFSWLCEHQSSDYKGVSWGYPFTWANPEKKLPVFTPTAVVTGFVIRGIFAYYKLTKIPEALEMMRGAVDFVLDELHITKNDDGVCFSYTHFKQDCCYNASLLAAETLARMCAVSHDHTLYNLSCKAVDFVVSHQHSDGRWNYSIDLQKGIERAQIDFHQGYVLESISNIMELLQIKSAKYSDAITKGSDYYYSKQFFPHGQSRWRLPKVYPVDIHNQSQGIITFTRLGKFNPLFSSFAHKIADWTISHMLSEQGYFYYQKHYLFTNRISYMRWSQAWMLLALTTLMATQVKETY